VKRGAFCAFDVRLSSYVADFYGLGPDPPSFAEHPQGPVPHLYF